MARLITYRELRRRRVLFGFSLAVVLPLQTAAADEYWSGSDSSWSSANNWSPYGVPTQGNVYLVGNSSYSQSISYDVTSPTDLSFLQLAGSSMSSPETLSIPANSLTAVTLNVGGAGTLYQYGGTTNCTTFNLGGYLGAFGVYTLVDGALNATIEELGTEAVSAFTQTGGTNTVATSGSFSLGATVGSQAIYTLSGTGTLSVNTAEMIGADGDGVFNQTGGSNTINLGYPLYIAQATGDTGTYTLSGNGSLTVTGSEYVGVYATGTFNQSGGTHTVQVNLTVGLGSRPGTYLLSGVGSLSVGQNVTVGTGGVFNQTGGIASVAGNITNNGQFSQAGSFNVSGNFTNSGTATLGGVQSWATGSTFINTAGTTAFQSDAGAGGANLSINVSGGSILFSSNQHLASLSVASGADARVVANSSGQRSVVFTPALSVAGTLDLSGNDLVIQGGNPAAISSLLKQGLGSGGGWNGTGITSSLAAEDGAHLTALGMMLNTLNGTTPLYGSGAPLGLFDGTSPGPKDVLIRYTYVGDADLNGKVDGSDYSRIDSGYLAKATGWSNGDFNYDGVVNGSDYTLIDNAFNRQGAQFSDEIASPLVIPTAQIATAPVPEPGSILIPLIAASACLRRRGRGRAAVNPGPGMQSFNAKAISTRVA